MKIWKFIIPNAHLAIVQADTAEQAKLLLYDRLQRHHPYPMETNWIPDAIVSDVTSEAPTVFGYARSTPR